MRQPDHPRVAPRVVVSARSGPVAGLLRRAMGDRKGMAFVVLVLLVGAVEGLEEGLLLVIVVLVGLRLGQVLDGAVGHGGDSWRVKPAGGFPLTRFTARKSHHGPVVGPAGSSRGMRRGLR